MPRLVSACLAIAGAGIAWAATTATWEMNTFQDFLPGRFDGVSLSRDGQLALAPRLETFYATEQPVIWSLVADRDGAVYAGTGHRGRLYRVSPDGKGELIWTAPEPEIFALASDGKGTVYAGTSPEGRVYRIENGKAEEYYRPQATYIWSLAVGSDGALYVGTGTDGKVFRVTGAGRGEVYYETGQTHVTSLALDSEGRLLAGTEPNGILYRVTGAGKAFALYDADLPEIRALVPGPEGAVYVAALGGSLSQRVQAAESARAQAASGGTVSTSITVTANAQSDALVQPGVGQQPAQAVAPAPAPPPIIEVSGVEKSALFRIHPDNTVEKLWSSKEENLYDLLLAGRDVLFTTDRKGRIYRLTEDRKETLIAQTNEGEATRILSGPAGLLATSGTLGRILRLGGPLAETGEYESPVHDAGKVARWGRMRWMADACANCRLAIRTRSGNSVRPDNTWSEWSEPLSDAEGSLVTSPNARFLQWKVELAGAAGRSPMVDSVTVAYLPQNSAPVINSIVVSNETAPKEGAAAAASQQAATASYSITVTASGDASSPSAGSPTTRLTRIAGEKLRVSWTAEDYDGDTLVYDLYFRGEEERAWKPLKRRIEETSWVIDSDALADGAYYFRVVASDRPDNDAASAREAEMTSARVLVDHTPPMVRIEAPRTEGTVTVVKVAAEDAASALRRAEYSLNAGPWLPVSAADGVTDSPREEFEIRLENLPPGEHLLVFRVSDSAGNHGLAKILLP
jgi:hypothetical protein